MYAQLKRISKVFAVLFISMAFAHTLSAQTQIGQDIDGEASQDQSGWSVSMSSDGKRVAIAASEHDGNSFRLGQVRIYELVGGVWSQLGQDIDGISYGDRSGWSVSIAPDGSRVAIGATQWSNSFGDQPAGYVRVYELVGSVWTQLGLDIVGEALNDQSGYSVSMSLDGSRVAIGAIDNDGNANDAGHVRVYELVGGVWTQLGLDIDGEAVRDYSGCSVSISSDGSRVAIGARDNHGSAYEAGHVRVYELVGGVWTQLGLDIDGEAASDQSGSSVSMSSDGSRVAIGAYRNDGNGSEAGHVRVFELVSGIWTQLGLDIDGEAANDWSGYSLSLTSDGSRVAIGAFRNDGNGSDAGHVRVFELVGGVWTQLGVDIDGEVVNDLSGGSVSMSSNGKRVAIGAPWNDGNGTDAGHVRVYDLSGNMSTADLIDENTRISIYPNPTPDKVFIQAELGVKIQLFDIDGKLLSEKEALSNETVFDLSAYAKGMYLLKVTTNKQVVSQQVMKN